MKGTDNAERSRKRSRLSEDGEEASTSGGKKTRGRPRVDTQDATAADVSTHVLRPFHPLHEATRLFSFLFPKLETNMATSVEEHRSVLHSVLIDSVKKRQYLRSSSKAPNYTPLSKR